MKSEDNLSTCTEIARFNCVFIGPARPGPARIGRPGVCLGEPARWNVLLLRLESGVVTQDLLLLEMRM